MAEVKLFKKKATYTSKKDNTEKTATNFYVMCGDKLIPIKVKFFGGDDGQDSGYSSRVSVLSAFADELPEKDTGKGA